MTDNHTPTPWNYSDVKTEMTVKTSGARIRYGCVEHFDGERFRFVAYVKNKEDGEKIAKACNSHDALVEALKAMLNASGLRPGDEVVMAENALRMAGA